MSQEPASSQLSFHSAAEEWNEDINLSDAPVDDDGLLDFERALPPFQNPAEGSEWHTHENLIYAASYQDIIRQINEFTGPRDYAVGVKNAKRRGKNGNLTKPFYRAYIKCDRKCPKKKDFNEFARVRETTSRN
jgi:hypothetical protein